MKNFRLKPKQDSTSPTFSVSGCPLYLSLFMTLTLTLHASEGKRGSSPSSSGPGIFLEANVCSFMLVARIFKVFFTTQKEKRDSQAFSFYGKAACNIDSILKMTTSRDFLFDTEFYKKQVGATWASF